MPKLNVQQNNQNVIQAFANALAIGRLKGIIASDGNHNFSTAGSNRNLLDNPWFTVNQRGQSSYTGRVYGVDRWIEYGSSNTVTVTSDGITLPVDKNSGFEQYFDDTFIQGKTVTISFMTADGTVTSKTVTWPTSGANMTAYTNGVAFFFGTVVGKKGLAILTNAEVTIRAVKLELGSVSTLANDVPPDYGTELIKCRGYFERIHSLGSSEIVGMGMGVSASSVRIGIPSLICHTIQSVTYSGGGLLLEGGGNYRTLTSIGKLNATPKNGFLTVTCGSSDAITLYQTYALVGTAAGGYIDISADL